MSVETDNLAIGHNNAAVGNQVLKADTCTQFVYSEQGITLLIKRSCIGGESNNPYARETAETANTSAVTTTLRNRLYVPLEMFI